MAPISPGVQTAPSRKPKKPTPTTKLHRFEPFTKRIARLKIDPVHTVEKGARSKDDSHLLHSYFRTSLEEWAELNLSQTFTTFLNKASPLCENLPQLLHHANTIFDLLVEGIEKKDELALEPLLSLLAHLAHDLGHGFEQYFSRTVVLVAEVAASQERAEVIEWCFTYLAWMFKYLSRLLVEDLRPLLDIMTPYLSAKKDYIVRFSAESLAFLLRKAAVLYQKRKAPLTLAVEHLLHRLVQDEGSASPLSYQTGVMSLLVESARGIDGLLHSCAESLVRCLLTTAVSMGVPTEVRSTVEGTLIALIHETNSIGFEPVLGALLEAVRRCSSSHEAVQISFAVRLLTISLGTRKGSRVSTWSDPISTFLDTAVAASRTEEAKLQIIHDLVTTTAEIIQFAPMDQMLPYLQKLLNFASEHFSTRQFFAFCTICAELGNERFTDLVLPRLQQYIAMRWADDEVSVHYILERLRQDGFLQRETATTGSTHSMKNFESFIFDHLSTDSIKDGGTPLEQLAGRIHLIKNIGFLESSEILPRLLAVYRKWIENALEETGNDPDLRRRISLGWAFDTFLDIVPNDDPELKGLVAQVLNTLPIHFRMPGFITASRRLMEKVTGGGEFESRSTESIRYVLVENMLSPSLSLKKESLRLLCFLAGPDMQSWISETTNLMLEIFATPYTPAEARKIAMLLRRLPQRQREMTAESPFQNLIPFFCLGLLTHYHDQTRREVCNVIAQMVEAGPTEECVLNVAIQWLQAPPEITPPSESSSEHAFTRSSAFECAHLARLESLCSTISDDFLDSSGRLLAMAESGHRLENTRTPEQCRSLALHVLSTIPASSERRSRLLVPIFLAAPMNRGQMAQKPSSDTSTSSHTLSPDLDDHEWSLADRKALLTLFAKFINPRVLFRSGEVYEKLVELLGNGNSELRKLALQAILTWKDPVLSRHESALLQVAEEKSATTDVIALLNIGEEQDGIGSSDRKILFPILLRLVFGLIVGRSGTSGSQDARRKSILRTLFRLSEHETAMFLDIALGKLKNVELGGPLPQSNAVLEQSHVPEDQQHGFLRLLLSTLETLQSQFAPYGPQVVDAVVFCVTNASRQPHGLVKSAGSATPFSRNIRRTGYQCLVLLFEHCPAIDWQLYLPTLFSNAISPRLEIFASETNQGISGLMRLFACWARSNDLVSYLGDYDKRVSGSLWSCLAAPSSQTEVKLFVLTEIVLPWTALADDQSINPNHGRELLQAESEGLLKALTALLERTPSREILNAITTVLPPLASLVKSSESRMSTITLLTSLLRNPGLKIPPNVRSQLLRSIHSFLAASDHSIDEVSWTALYQLVSSLFNYFKDLPNRQLLCQVLDILSHSNQLAGKAAQLCTDLNAVSTQRLDEIDYDTRLRAFQTIQSLEAERTGRILWEPIVYNLLFFVRTHDDFSIRSNAMGCLRHFVPKACQADQPDLIELITTAILPVVKKSVRDESELVRADFVSLLGLLVQNVSGNEGLSNMKPLLVGNDEEASFFSNILHIQQHRRVRAIGRLVSEAEKGAISTLNTTEIFIPLLEMFVQDSSTDESAQSTKGQSVAAMATLLQWIDWKHFKTIFHRYKNDIGDADANQKATSRLLGHAADALIVAKGYRATESRPNYEQRAPHLAASLPEYSMVEKELRTHFIPKLAELIHYKDEAEISFRLPIGVTAIKLITMLPSDELPIVAAPIILDIAHILRSRAQESRDAARNALCQIVMLLGPSSLQFVLKEMRTALTRGYQLHVVSYTLHSILVAIAPSIQQGDLDYCVEDLVLVIMDDIFGTVGQEKDNQDYVSTMREVKSSKSYDSMELLAKSISVSSVSALVFPIQTLLGGSLTSKQVRQIDELLRRIGSGLSHNPSANKREILTFAYQLIQRLYQQKNQTLVGAATNDEKNRQRYLVQLSSANRANGSHNSALLYKLARFALDMVRSTLQKHADILTAENVHGFLPIIGDALVEGQEDVKISALRLLSAIIKLPMSALDQNASLYVSEAVKVVKNSTSTNEEAAQAALKLIAAVLRERKSVKIRDSDVGSLLHRITPDIEEPDRQGVTFNFIRAVMARKIELPEIYELADKIGIMMVTNHTKGARDIARGVYVNFLLEYPQSSARWSKQQKFLMKNLEYDHPEGRQSVMEAINTLVTKTKGEAAQELISTFFIPILLRMANDDNKGCRELAAALLGQIFLLSDRSHLNEILQPLMSWIDQDENRALQKVSIQSYSILLSTGRSLPREEVDHIRNSILKTLETSSTDDDDEWELQFQTLLLLVKMVDTQPGYALNKNQTRLWSFVWASLSYHNVWVQSTSADLISKFLSHCVSADRSKLPLICEHGLSLDSNAFLQILKSSVRILRRTGGNEDLSTQMVQILLFMGQYLDSNGLTMQVAPERAMEDNLQSDQAEDSASDDALPPKTRSIPAIQYLLDQMTRILRVEMVSITSAAFVPKKSALTLLSHLLPNLSKQNLPPSRIHDVLLPLQHLTDPNTIPPRSADPTFAETYKTLIELAHEVMEKVQKKLGDAEYVKALTEVSKIMRARREDRRIKRRIERVAEPEKAARDKKRKSDRKKERKREIGKTFQKRRREMGM